MSFAYLRGKLSEILEGRPNEKDNPDSTGSRKVFIMDSVAAFIEDNYFRDDLSLSELAGIAGMSRFEFCRTFKRRFGQSFTTYLNDARIRKAVDMLDNPDIKITEVAQNVGYNCVTYFERVFKSRHGISPGQYRKKAERI